MGVFGAWVVAVGLITVRDLNKAKRLPYPSELLASVVIYGLLGLISESPSARPAAVMTAWGLDVAIFLSPNAGVPDALKAAGQFLGGQSASPTSTLAPKAS